MSTGVPQDSEVGPILAEIKGEHSKPGTPKGQNHIGMMYNGEVTIVSREPYE